MPLLSLVISLILFWLTQPFQAQAHESLQYRTFRDREGKSALRVHLVKIDLQDPRIRVSIALAHDKAHGKERVGGMAERTQALAAINGSFFHGTTVTSAVGLIMRDGEIIADSRHRRTSLGITADHRVVIGIPHIQTGLYFFKTNTFQPISGVNQPRQRHQTIVYTSHFGTHTQTNSAGQEIIVEKNRVVRYGTGNSSIPRQGFVISVHGKSRLDIQRRYPLGTQISLQIKSKGPWKNVRTVMTGAPHLVHRGRIYNTYDREKLHPSLKAPNARSAIGYTHNQKLLLINVFPEKKGRGVTYTRLAQIMRRLGAVEAMGLDGGSSTSLYVFSKGLQHSPRPVSNALIITMIPHPLQIPGYQPPPSRYCNASQCS